MIITPLNNDDIISSFSHNVTDSVLITPLVFNKHFLTRSFRPMDTHKQDVGSWKKKLKNKYQ